MNNSPELKHLVDEHEAFFLNAIQKMSMTKCFKAILLEAYLELDSFHTPPSIKALSEKLACSL